MAIERLIEFKELGVQLAIDDFGTGYSSLNYVRQFPIDMLKIDKSFVDGLVHESSSASLVATVLELARVLGLRAVAEGVEETDQLGHLQDLQLRARPGLLVRQAAQPARPAPGPEGAARRDRDRDRPGRGIRDSEGTAAAEAGRLAAATNSLPDLSRIPGRGGFRPQGSARTGRSPEHGPRRARRVHPCRRRVRASGVDAPARRHRNRVVVRNDTWLDSWSSSVSDLARLKSSHPMMDAVIDEQRGRQIRIGDQWLADFASCNYLGFDLDEEIIAKVPEHLAQWGTHPSWSRLLGSPRLYPEIEEQMTELLGCEDVLLLPTITLIHSSVIPILAGHGTIFLDGRAHKTIYDGCMYATSHGATVQRFQHDDWQHLEILLRASDPNLPRLVVLDGVNSMTGNAPDVAGFARVAREYDALLYIDDAHGFGVVGERSPDELCDYGLQGNSIMRHLGVGYDNVVLVGGFSKAYSSLLAFLALPDEAEGRDEGSRPAVPLLGSVAGRVAVDHAHGARGEPQARRPTPVRPVAHEPPRPRRARRDVDLHAEPVGLPAHRDPAGRSPRHRRGRSLPLRQRHLRDARRVPARAEARGRASACR